jgi:hypothetical protein
VKKEEKALKSILDSRLQDRDAFTLEVTRYFCDNAGSIIDPTTLPANLKTRFPFFLFNKFDAQGAYSIGKQICPTDPGIYFLYQNRFQFSFDLFQFSGGANPVVNRMVAGDFYQVYADAPINFNFLIFVVVHVQFRSYSAMLDGIHMSKPSVYEVLYQSDNAGQYSENIFKYKEDSTGVYESDQFTPLSYKTPDIIQPDFISIPLKYQFYPLSGFASYIQFATSYARFNFKIKI